MRRWYRHIFLLTLIIGSFGLFLRYHPSVQAAAGDCEPRFQSENLVPSGYGAAFNVFSAAKELIVGVTCPNTDAIYKGGSDDVNYRQYVYKKAYRWDGSRWIEVTMQGIPVPDTGGMWLQAGATTTLAKGIFRPSGLYNYFAAYTCTFANAKWNCGCRTVDCAINLWQLQSFRSPLVLTPTGGTGCTTGGDGPDWVSFTTVTIPPSRAITDFQVSVSDLTLIIKRRTDQTEELSREQAMRILAGKNTLGDFDITEPLIVTWETNTIIVRYKGKIIETFNKVDLYNYEWSAVSFEDLKPTERPDEYGVAFFIEALMTVNFRYNMGQHQFEVRRSLVGGGTTGCTLTVGGTSGTTVGGTTGTVTGNPNQVLGPIVAPFGGYFMPTQNVTITDGTAGATIHYTLDGTDPTETSTTYINVFTLSATTTVKAKAWKAGMDPSPVVIAQFYKGTAPKGGSGIVGKSGMPWNAGQWINGGSDRIEQYTRFMGHESDAVTQGMGDVTTWPNVGGADSEAEVDADFNRSPAEWNARGPVFHGVFTDAGWFRHIWGAFPATEARKRIIHLDWAEPIPSTVGNKWNGSNYANPTLYKDIKEGAADKYIFLLGRKFAWLDRRDGDPAFPMTLDFFYEFTLETHGKSPEGSYTDATGRHFTYQDFPYAVARWTRVFMEGCRYQRGSPCPYLFNWRPQLNFINSDRRGGGSTIRSEVMWPNNVASWVPGQRIINGVTVLPPGPVGKTIDFVSASWHDSSFDHVQGSSATAPGNNWARILAGNAAYWGFNEIAAFARAQGVKMTFPEWAPRREGNFSPYAADVIRFTYAFFNANKDILDHESYFDQGDGSIYQDWPDALAGQDPRPVYRQLWNGR